MSKRIELMLGNEACVQGALAAKCDFFAGYPITPSSEVAESFSRIMPKIGGKFIQMEDELASIACIIGASATGARAMTATSGPGVSLMLENMGYAYMAELPVVIINVQRGGPSTGLPTKLGQADVMQARWGTHGDFTAIVIAPDSIQETYYLTIRAFNLAQKYQTPVMLLLDEILGHMREKVVIPDEDEIEVFYPPETNESPEDYEPYPFDREGLAYRVPFGKGYRYNITGLTHNNKGFPTADSVEITKKLDNMRNKIMDNYDDIVEVEIDIPENPDVILYAFGSVSRSAKSAAMQLKDKGITAGLFRPITIWPFAEKELKRITDYNVPILVVEENQGQLVHEVQKVVTCDIPVHSLFRYDGEIITPKQVIDKVEEVL